MEYNIELTKKEIRNLEDGMYALIRDYNCKLRDKERYIDLIRKLENVLKQKYKKKEVS